jgi:hypothetical protein
VEQATGDTCASPLLPPSASWPATRALCSSCAPVDPWRSSGRAGSRAGAEVHQGRGGGLELRLELGQRPSAGLAVTDPSSGLIVARLPFVLSRSAEEACVGGPQATTATVRATTATDAASPHSSPSAWLGGGWDSTRGARGCAGPTFSREHAESFVSEGDWRRRDFGVFPPGRRYRRFDAKNVVEEAISLNGLRVRTHLVVRSYEPVHGLNPYIN